MYSFKHNLIFFFNWKSCSVLEILKFLNYSLNFKSCDVRMSINTREHFWIYLSMVLKFGQLVDMTIRSIFCKNLAWLRELSPTPQFLPIFLPTAINQKAITMSLWFFTFLTVCVGTIKNNKQHLLKTNKTHYIPISPKS